MYKEEPCWVRLDGATGKLMTTVKASVRPTNRRRWNHDHETWEIHWQWLHQVAGWARGLGYEVDWSALPETWQMVAAGASVTGDVNSPLQGTANPFETLYVAENAPREVVHAAYRALARKFHPDIGGDEDEFKKIDAAYRAIRKARRRE
jgi:hypothetical protein